MFQRSVGKQEGLRQQLTIIRYSSRELQVSRQAMLGAVHSRPGLYFCEDAPRGRRMSVWPGYRAPGTAKSPVLTLVRRRGSKKASGCPQFLKVTADLADTQCHLRNLARIKCHPPCLLAPVPACSNIRPDSDGPSVLTHAHQPFLPHRWSSMCDRRRSVRRCEWREPAFTASTPPPPQPPQPPRCVLVCRAVLRC